MSSLLPNALVYLQKGYSVIPVGKDKRPLVNWKDYQTRQATVEEITEWFSQNPDAQIGIVTGEISNLTVVDIESDGDFNRITDATFTVETGGKGRHYFFEYEKEFKNAVRIFPSVDVRSQGGYVVAPPSVTQKGAYTALNDLKVAKMSLVTKEAFLAQNRRQLPWYASSGESSYPKIESKNVEYQGSGEGSRNDSMTKFAGSLHAKLHQSLWASIGWQMFEQANHKNTPPLSAYELRVIWNSIGNREVQTHPSGRDFSTPTTKEKTWGPEPEKPKITAHKYEDSLSDSDDEVADIAEEKVDSRETLHASDVAAAQSINSDVRYAVDMPVFDDALLGGFAAGDLIVVAGQSGHGKTTIIQDWSVTLASGGQSKKDKLPALWFSYEVLAKPLWQKFQGMGADNDTPIYMPRFNESGDTEWVVDVILRAIDKWGIKVVAIDHLGFLRPPKGNYSNAADAITHTVRALKKIAVQKGLIIMLPVHVRKTVSKVPDLNDIRDSLGIAQEADTVFFIGREKDDSGLPTQQAKLWLVKNRASGISVNALFDFEFGRYYYNAGETVKRAEVDARTAAAIKDFDAMPD